MISIQAGGAVFAASPIDESVDTVIRQTDLSKQEKTEGGSVYQKSNIPQILARLQELLEEAAREDSKLGTEMGLQALGEFQSWSENTAKAAKEKHDGATTSAILGSIGSFVGLAGGATGVAGSFAKLSKTPTKHIERLSAFADPSGGIGAASNGFSGLTGAIGAGVQAQAELDSEAAKLDAEANQFKRSLSEKTAEKSNAERDRKYEMKQNLEQRLVDIMAQSLSSVSS